MRTDFIGDSPLVEALRHQLHAAAPTDLTVLLLGETGTGKGIAARYLHAHSHRAQGPLVYVNCGGAQAALIDSELFGHEKGAFTGAIATRPGKFERAQGGTIFLDEIGDLPAEAQTRLLQVLQEGRIERVGSTGVRPVDVRVLAATHCNLEQAVRQQRFRADLYYRLKVMPVQLPPLRLHPEDMPTLVAHFI